MGMNFDFGSFFGNNSSNSGGLSSLLGDYASIKNGSYRKLMKAYYSESGNGVSGSKSKSKSSKSVAEKLIDEKKKMSMRVETKESKAYTAVKSASNKLTESANRLAETGEASVFAKRDITTVDENGLEMVNFDYDKEAIYKAVDDFVTNYNSVLKTTAGVGNYSIANRVTSMQNETKANEQLLNQLGITINADNSLTIDKDNFMKANMKTAEDLFNIKSYTKVIAASSNMIRQNANYEQLRGNTYTYDGTFNSSNTSGSSFNSSL